MRILYNLMTFALTVLLKKKNIFVNIIYIVELVISDEDTMYRYAAMC